MVHVSGKPRPEAEGLTIRQLLERDGYVQARVAVELNEQILEPVQFERTLRDGDVVEVVEFMGGGC